jgi:hypothetical protein
MWGRIGQRSVLTHNRAEENLCVQKNRNGNMMAFLECGAAVRGTDIIALRGQTFSYRLEFGALGFDLRYKVPELSDAEWQKIIDSASKYDTEGLWLSLSYNRIRAIPETISTLTNLQKLDLSCNKIRLIPESITALVNLRSLSLKRNKIDDVPDVLAEMSKLKALRINKNPFIKKIPSSFQLGERFIDWWNIRCKKGMRTMPIIIYFKQHRVTRMAIALVWNILPMPIAEEIEPHVTEIDSPNEKKRNAVAEVNPKRRRINK